MRLSPGWREPWRCSSWKAFTQPFPCIAGFWPIPISAREKSIQDSSSDFWRRARRSRRSRFICGRSMPMIRLPRLYAIIDSSCFPDANALFAAAQELEAGGCSLVQYRNKSGNARIMLEQSRELRRRLGRGVKLMMNDRADLCLAAEFDGVHVGQDDLSPESVRKIVGPEFWLGVSTHNPAQLQSADATSADYIAIGPIFFTP